MVQVGDRIRILVDGAEGANVKKGDEFIVGRHYNENSISVVGVRAWSFSPKSYEVIRAASLKDPIEYLKSAHADGDMIDPATMLRECYGITKTERVVVEWSEATKREIKVGDKVRIVGPASYTDQSAFMGQVKEVMSLNKDETGVIYDIGPVKGGWSFYFPASSVELV